MTSKQSGQDLSSISFSASNVSLNNQESLNFSREKVYSTNAKKNDKDDPGLQRSQLLYSEFEKEIKIELNENIEMQDSGVMNKILTSVPSSTEKEISCKQNKNTSPTQVSSTAYERLILEKSEPLSTRNLHALSASTSFFDIVKRSNVDQSASQLFDKKSETTVGRGDDEDERKSDVLDHQQLGIGLGESKSTAGACGWAGGATTLARSRSRLLAGRRKYQFGNTFTPDLFEEDDDDEEDRGLPPPHDPATRLVEHQPRRHAADRVVKDASSRTFHKFDDQLGPGQTKVAQVHRARSRLATFDLDAAEQELRQASSLTQGDIKTKSSTTRVEDLVFDRKNPEVVWKHDQDITMKQKTNKRRPEQASAGAGQQQQSNQGRYVQRLARTPSPTSPTPNRPLTPYHHAAVDRMREHAKGLLRDVEKVHHVAAAAAPAAEKEKLNAIAAKQKASASTTGKPDVWRMKEREKTDVASPTLEKSLDRKYQAEQAERDAILNGPLKRQISKPRFEPKVEVVDPRVVDLVEQINPVSDTNERERLRDEIGGRLSRGSTVSLRDTNSTMTVDEIDVSKTELLDRPIFERPDPKMYFKEYPKRKPVVEDDSKKGKKGKKGGDDADAAAATEAPAKLALEDPFANRKPRVRKKVDPNVGGGGFDGAGAEGGAGGGGPPKLNLIKREPSPDPDEEARKAAEEAEREAAARAADEAAAKEAEERAAAEREAAQADELAALERAARESAKRKEREAAQLAALKKVPEKKPEVIVKIERIYSPIPDVPEETLPPEKPKRKLDYLSPLIHELVNDPDLIDFNPPPPPPRKPKKKDIKKPNPRIPLPYAPDEVPKDLFEYDPNAPSDEDVDYDDDMPDFNFNKKNPEELARLAEEMKEFELRERESVRARAWLQGRVAFATKICKFELPTDLRKLHGMTPAQYLSNFSAISPRRLKIYEAAFERQFERRANDNPSASVLRCVRDNRSTTSQGVDMTQLNVVTSGGASSPLGCVKTRQGLSVDLHRLFSNGTSHTLVEEKPRLPRGPEEIIKASLAHQDHVLTLKEAANGLAEIHVGGVTDKELNDMFKLCQLTSKETQMIDLKLFCGLCALLERLYYIQFLAEEAKQVEDTPRVMLEVVDFVGINPRLDKISVTPGLRQLFDILTQ